MMNVGILAKEYPYFYIGAFQIGVPFQFLERRFRVWGLLFQGILERKRTCEVI